MALMRENGNSEFRNWELMKSLMTRHFIPPDVKDKFYLKLQRLKQGDLSVEDYVKVFKLFVIASDLGESEVQKIKRFISGLKSEIRKDFSLVLQWSPFLSLKNIISLALERKSWSTKVDSESGANVEVVLSDYKEKHEHQLFDKTMQESIIHEEKYEKEVVVCEETEIECEFENNESVETIKVVGSQIEEKNKENERQFEVLPPKEIFEDLSQQIEEFQSSSGETLRRKTSEIERIVESELSVKDYAKEFKLFVISSDLGESEGQKIERFVGGLKSEIRKDFGLVLK